VAVQGLPATHAGARVAVGLKRRLTGEDLAEAIETGVRPFSRLDQ